MFGVFYSVLIGRDHYKLIINETVLYIERWNCKNNCGGDIKKGIQNNSYYELKY